MVGLGDLGDLGDVEQPEAVEAADGAVGEVDGGAEVHDGLDPVGEALGLDPAQHRRHLRIERGDGRREPLGLRAHRQGLRAAGEQPARGAVEHAPRGERQPVRDVDRQALGGGPRDVGRELVETEHPGGHLVGADGVGRGRGHLGDQPVHVGEPAAVDDVVREHRRDDPAAQRVRGDRVRVGAGQHLREVRREPAGEHLGVGELGLGERLGEVELHVRHERRELRARRAPPPRPGGPRTPRRRAARRAPGRPRRVPRGRGRGPRGR